MKRKNSQVFNPDVAFLLVGLITLLIVAIPLTEWVVVGLLVDVMALVYAIFRYWHRSR